MKLSDILKIESQKPNKENFWYIEPDESVEGVSNIDDCFVLWNKSLDIIDHDEMLLPNGCPPTVDFDDTNIHCPFRIINDKLVNQGLEIENFKAPFSNNTIHISEDGKKILNNGLDIANFEEPFSKYVWRIDKEQKEDSSIKKLINTGIGVANFEKPFNYNNWRFGEYYEGEKELIVGRPMETFGAFSNSKTLPKITLPNNINKLGEETFTRSELTKVIIENNNLEIDPQEHTFSKDVEIIYPN